MGLTQSINDQIVDLIKQDKSKELHDVLVANSIPPNQLFHGGRTGIVLCALYDSINCLKVFIDLGNDINIADSQDNSTPLIIASKFNFLAFTQKLIEHKAIVKVINLNGFNAFDIAFLRGNYEICYYFYTNDILSPQKTLENYIALNEQLHYPLFNMEMFYTSLMNKIPFDQAPSFRVIPKRRKELEGKIPDPNETWGHFAKRMWNMELYQPPLVESNSVGSRNTLYMRMQTGLVEMEYDVNLDLHQKKEQRRDIELNEQEVLTKEKVDTLSNDPKHPQHNEMSNKSCETFTENHHPLSRQAIQEELLQHKSPMTEVIRSKSSNDLDNKVILKEVKSEERRRIDENTEFM